MAVGPGRDERRRWSVSELADATGLSVRVLRHWDQVGLVTPERSAGGHRCYCDGDVRRLYRVLAMREMGLPLRNIAALLADTDPSPGPPSRPTYSDGVEPDIDADLLMKVVEKMTMFEQHLTAEQRTWFAQRREHVGEQAWQDAIEQWPELITAVRGEMDAGTDPADPRVQELMTRWDALRRVFLDDDAEMRTAAGRAWQAMWKQHPEQLGFSPRLAPPEMWDYVQRAQQAR